MSPDKLVHMANQIATFFKSQPGEGQAEKVAAHLRDFWDPRMREELGRYIETSGAGLDGLVIEASRRL